MTQPFQDQISFAGGYFPNQGLIGGERVPDTLIEGSKNVWVEGPNRIRSWEGASSYASYGNAIMGLLGNRIYTMATGSATLYRGGAVFYIGSAVQIGTTTAITVGGGLGVLKFTTNTTTSNAGDIAGLSQALQPTATLSAATATQLQPGTYSFKTTLIRPSTNAEGNGSPATPNIEADGTKKITLTFPGGFGTSGLEWGIYSSKKGFPDGPWFFLRKVPTTTGSIDLDFRDGDLGGTKAPIDHDPPLDGTHVFALGDIVILAGILGGGGISPSKPGKPEAFPPDTITFLNPNEPIIGIRGRPADGWQYVFCRNSLHSVFLTGDDLAPVGVRAIWSETGISNPSAASFVGGEFYGYSGKRGALRTTAGNQTAEPDVTFALPIESDMASWNPNNVVVGYSLDEDAVVYFHGNIAWPFKRKLGRWSAPFTLADGGAAGNVTSCVTFQGKLIFSIGSTMYEFGGGGSTTIPWTIMPVWHDGGAESWYKTITRWRTAYDVGSSTLTSQFLTNFNTTQVRSSQMITGTVPDYGPWKKTNVKKAVAYTIRHSGTGANRYVYGTTILGGVSRITV